MALPQHLAEDILLSYSDILRVGRLRFNGELLAWSTKGTTRHQLEAFAEALVPPLRSLPDVSSEVLDDIELFELLVSICKAVSINYIVHEVLDLLRTKTGHICSVQTRDDKGCQIEYFVNTRPGLRFEAGIAWTSKNNIVACSPDAKRMRVVGTLSRVQTDFSLLPQATGPQCKVIWRQKGLSLKLPKWMRILTLSRLRRSLKTEVIDVEEPLCSSWRTICSIAAKSPAVDVKRAKAPQADVKRLAGHSCSKEVAQCEDTIMARRSCFAGKRLSRHCKNQDPEFQDSNEVLLSAGTAVAGRWCFSLRG
jgi:hypothetical protein